MCAGRNFRHHTAIGFVIVKLAGNDFAEYLRHAVFKAQHSRSCFVAAGFDAENDLSAVWGLLHDGRGCSHSGPRRNVQDRKQLAII